MKWKSRFDFSSRKNWRRRRTCRSINVKRKGELRRICAVGVMSNGDQRYLIIGFVIRGTRLDTEKLTSVLGVKFCCRWSRKKSWITVVSSPLFSPLQLPKSSPATQTRTTKTKLKRQLKQPNRRREHPKRNFQVCAACATVKVIWYQTRNYYKLSH